MPEIQVKETEIPEDILENWQSIVDIMTNIMAVPSAIITRAHPPEIEIIKSARSPENPYKQGDKVLMAKHYCESVVTNNQKLQVSFAPEDPSWKNAPEVDYGMVAYLGYPVCWSSGHMFGTICAIDNKENQFGSLYESVLNEFKNLIEAHLSLIEKNEELKSALSEVKTLRGMLPICMHCKKIRDDTGYWYQLESYIQKHSEAEFSHSICQECAKKYYPDMDLYDD